MFAEIQEKLIELSDENVAISGYRFFKEPVEIRGVSAHTVQKLTRTYFKKLDQMTKAQVFELCEELMKTNYQEEFLVACEFSCRVHKKFVQSDFDIFEKWVKKYINNWAKCDTFCNHTIGIIIEKFPDLIPRVKQWVKSENRWVRRAAAVSFIIPARCGLFIDDVFEIADFMLLDTDDMVRKGYGWALKSAGVADAKRVYDFVTARVAKMPRIAYRYAIEKLPPEMRAAAMKL